MKGVADSRRCQRGVEITVKRAEAERRKGKGYRELLLKAVGKKRYESIAKGYDLLGNIAIIDADRVTAAKVARIIMGMHRQVETVLRKEGAVKGRYRTRKYEFVLGKRNYMARYNENGASFSFDVRKTFFSPRLAYERKRVVELSEDGEKVIVMFAGVGPFAIEIGKKNKNSVVVAIELNKASYRYMKGNIVANGAFNVVPVLGDAAIPLRSYMDFADRIVMPFPSDPYRFAKAAFAMAGRRCIIHYYVFAEDGGVGETDRLKELAAEEDRGFRLIGRRVARPYSARISEIAIDFELKRR